MNRWKMLLAGAVAILLAAVLGFSLAAQQQEQTHPPGATGKVTHAAGKSQKAETDDAPETDQDEPEDEDLAPAAVQLDVSRNSPLIQTLYQATRETKEDAILAQLDKAKKQLAEGTDVKATDAQGRTALHWAVFGSSYATKPKVLVSYEEIADTLIQKGVEINKEDVYQDTALDYLLYAPTYEIQTLLIENGASSGFLAATYHFFDETEGKMPDTFDSAVAKAHRADLSPGLTLSVRLDGPVYSDRSRTGDPITATVTYPLCKGGENIACKDGELLIPPGTRVNGTVLFAAKAPDKYSRPRMVLDFSNILHKNGQKTPLYARVIDVDNARETVRNNEILGIIQPHASKKASIAIMAVSASNPIAGYAVKGVQTVYGLSIRREIQFPAGTDLQLQIVRPSNLRVKEQWSGWPQLTVDHELQKLASTAPMRTVTPGNAESDPTNLMFLGTQEQLQAAFGEAGWIEATAIGVKSAMKAAQATVRQSGYADAPVSTLLLNGRPPDVVFQKSLDTFAKRHHLRIWKMEKAYNGQTVWIAAATHDIAADNSRAGTKWKHRIDPHIDRERDWVATDLLFVGTGRAYADIERPAAPRKLANATGDEIVTDGKITVVQVAPHAGVTAAGATPSERPHN